jgi:hypothetical protein
VVGVVVDGGRVDIGVEVDVVVELGGEVVTNDVEVSTVDVDVSAGVVGASSLVSSGRIGAVVSALIDVEADFGVEVFGAVTKTVTVTTTLFGG